MKYEGTPSSFKGSMSPSTSSNLLRCIENKTFSNMAHELKNVLYNWLVGNVDQQTVERHFYPNKGNGYAALNLLMNDPSVQAYNLAEVNVSKQQVETLKCKGTNVFS
jgi:hypothetical protein